MSGQLRMMIGPANKRLKEALQNYDDVMPTSNDVTVLRQQLNTLLFTLRNMENALATLRNANDKWSQLMQRLDEEAQQKENDTFEQFALATRFIETMDAGEETIETLRIRQTEFETAIAQRQHIPAGPATTTTTDNIRLPQLRLPTFDGDATAFADFWAIFSTTVHTSNIDDAQKFAYLSSCLRGKATELIAGFSVTAANYNIVIQLLQEKYGSSAKVITTLVTQLRELPPCNNDATSIGIFYNSIERICRQLEQLNENVDTPFTVNSIEAKLPRSVMAEILRTKHGDPQWNLTKLRNALNQIVTLREEMAALNSQNSGLRQMNYSRPTTNPPFSTARQQTSRRLFPPSNAPNSRLQTPGIRAPTAVFQVGERQRAPTTPASIECPLCHGNHRVFDCTTYPTPQQRSTRANSQQLCRNCLGHNHRTVECISHGCTNCGKRHHTALCFSTSRNDTRPEMRPHNPTTRAPQQQQRIFTRGAPRNNAQPSANFTPMPRRVNSTPQTTTPALLTTPPMSQPTIPPPGFTPPTHRDSFYNENNDNNVVSFNVSTLNTTSILGTIPVNILWNNQHKTVYAVLDSGSERTFISEAVANELQLPTHGNDILQLQVCGSLTPQQHASRSVTVPIESVDGSVYSLKANTLAVLTQPLQHISACSDEPLPICVQPDLLIGVDHFLQLIIWQEPERLDSGFRLLHTRLGPALMGRGTTSTTTATNTITTMTTTTTTEINETRQQLARLWALDSIGIKDDALADNDDEKALQLFQESVAFKDGRYTVRWPWRETNRVLPSNYKIALSRLHSTYTTALNDDYLNTYNDVITDQLKRGIIERVNDPWNSTGALHYLPHFAVISPGKSTKCRVVYDAACKATKTAPSLNDLIYAGPALLPGLADILLRFRLPKIAILSDLEKAFLQIALDERDRDSVRFLWLKDINLPPTPDNIQTYRFARIAFGVVASPFILAATIRYHLQHHPTLLSDELLQNTYVDNIFLSADSCDAALQKYRDSKATFNAASMNARDYISNSREVNDQFDADDKSKAIETGVTKVLGLRWNFYDGDTIVLQLPAIDFSKRLTKRQVLRQVAKLFDPLGLVSPLLVQPKRYLQELWQQQLKWDQTVSSNDSDKWHNIMQTWQQQQFIFPRFIDTKQPHTLHCFVDASSMAYGAVVYVSCNDNTHILFSKSRITPMNKATIPRLELLAVLLGVRATQFVSNALQWHSARKVLWTDSSCVLHWIKKRQLHATFIQNRLNEIWAATGFEFRHIPTDKNPADILSRGATPDELRQNDLWLHGPPFIDDEAKWPDDIDVSITENDQPAIIHSAALQTAATDTTDAPTIECRRFGSWNKATRVTAYVWRFYRLLRKQTDDRGVLTATELDNAETTLLRESQKQLPATTTQGELMGLQPDDNGILRCTADRFVNSSNYRQLIYLPRDTATTRLLILHVHQRLHHSGVSHTLSEIRQRFWLPRGRQQVKKALNNCYACRRFNAKAFALPRMADLPAERLVRSAPFTYCGVDYIGPFNVTNNGIQQKIWTAIFTCYSTRLTHLEHVSSLSTESFIDAFKRFIARRGTPQQILSDQATNFTLASKALAQTFTPEHDVAINRYFAEQRITWKFTVEYSPWTGAIYERLIGILKNNMRRSLRQRQLSFEKFVTFLVEIEGVINSRPITYVSDDPQRVLRPIDFQQPHMRPGFPGATIDDHTDVDYLSPDTDSANKLLDRLTRSQKHINQFWALWQRDYLTQLRERAAGRHKRPYAHTAREPIVGEVVLVAEDYVPRGLWTLGIIVELVPSRDDEVRAVRLRMPNGHIHTRPISAIYPLEITCQDDVRTTNAEIAQPVNDNRRRTRARTRQIATHLTSNTRIPFYVFLCALFAASYATCPNDTYTRLLYHQHPCAIEDNIFTYERDNETRYCSQTKQRLPCTCPSWATGCSYYGESIRLHARDPNFGNHNVSWYDNKTTQFIQRHNPEICSFSLTANCSAVPHYGSFHLVQLFDGSYAYLHELHLRTRTFLERDIYCFNDGNANGTPLYCSVFNCTTNGTRFCFFRHPSITFAVDSTNDSLPIAAWGSVNRTYYLDRSQDAHDSRDSFQLACTNDGAVVALPTGVNFVEICSSSFCHKRHRPDHFEIVKLPTSVLLTNHHIIARVWIRGHKQPTKDINCPRKDICSLINCHLCWESFANAHCAPVEVAVLTVISVYAVLSIIVTTIFIIRECYSCSTNIYGKHKRRHRAPSQPKEPTETTVLTPATPSPPVRRIRYTPAETPTIVITILGLLCASLTGAHDNPACSTVDIVTTQSEECDITDTSLTCNFQSNNILTLSPQQTACLVLKAGDIPIGELSVTLADVALQCHKTSLFFTRDHIVKVTSQQLCHENGSCKNDRCSRLLPTDTINEFDGKFNDYPGTTHCTPRCGCWWCGCLHCHSSCVFHRHYAAPTHDRELYQVFRCPAWEPRAVVRVISKRNDIVESHQFNLLPNLNEHWQGVTIKIDIPTMPPLPLLSHPFIASATRAAILDESQLQQLQQLTCDSEEDAKQFRCTLSEKACECHDDDELNCQCQAGALAAVYNSHEALLPQNTPTLTLYADDTAVTAKFHEQSVAHVSIQLQDFQVANLRQATTCTIDIIAINGCYNCRNAAEITYQCHSKTPTIGHARCENTQFTVRCGPDNARQSAHASFDQSTIHTTCNLTCGGNDKTAFNVTGILHYISHVAAPTSENAKVAWLQVNHDSGIDWAATAWRLIGVTNVWLVVAVAIGVSPLAVRLARLIWCN